MSVYFLYFYLNTIFIHLFIIRPFTHSLLFKVNTDFVNYRLTSGKDLPNKAIDNIKGQAVSHLYIFPLTRNTKLGFLKTDGSFKNCS